MYFLHFFFWWIEIPVAFELKGVQNNALEMEFDSQLKMVSAVDGEVEANGSDHYQNIHWCQFVYILAWNLPSYWFSAHFPLLQSA